VVKLNYPLRVLLRGITLRTSNPLLSSHHLSPMSHSRLYREVLIR
jgi:hypothetical protein